MQSDLKQLVGADHAPVNGGGPLPHPLAEIVEHIAQTFKTYVEFERAELPILLALWCVLTHALMAFAFCGYIRLQSATPRCGKSRVLELLGLFVSGNPNITTQPTAAILFRGTRQVLLLDEVDNLRNRDKEGYGDVMAILNVGFKRGAVVERCEKSKRGWEVVEYPAYKAIAMAGLEKLNDSLNDRCFPVAMKRTKKRMPRLNIRRLEAESQTIRRDIDAWMLRHESELQKAYESLPHETPQLKGFDDRLQDIAEPLLVLAVAADAELGEGTPIKDSLVSALEGIARRREPSTKEESYIALIQLVESQLNGQADTFIRSQTLVELCQDDEQLSFLETPRKLANFVKPLDLSPINKGGGVRGYPVSQDWVDEWKGRYQ